MATSDFALLTVENTGGVLALKRKGAAEVVPESASPVIGAVSGGVAVLPDAAGERVLRSVKVNVEPVQSGSGDPAPDNVRPITGWTGAKVTRCGKNLLPNVKQAVNAANVMLGQTPSYTQGWESRLAPGTYVLSAVTTKSCYLRYRNADGTVSGNSSAGENPAMRFTVTEEDDFAFWAYNNAGVVPDDIVSFQLERGSAATEYEPYAGDTFDVAFPTEAGTVYGGVLDLTAGTLTVDRFYALFRATGKKENYFYSTTADLRIPKIPQTNAGLLCNRYPTVPNVFGSVTDPGITFYDTNIIRVLEPDYIDKTVEEYNEMLVSNPVEIVYQRENPVVYQLTPQQIAALAGLNNVFADCGPVEIEYVRDTGAVIEAANADTRAMIGEASGETASRSLAVGEYVAVGDKLYRVTSAVGAGETLVPGSNVTETTVGAELSRLAAMISQ